GSRKRLEGGIVQVKEIMTRKVEIIHPETSIAEAAEIMNAHDVGALPVCDGDNLIGMLTDRDITVRATADGFHPETMQAGEVMTADVIYGFEDQEVSDDIHCNKTSHETLRPLFSQIAQSADLLLLGGDLVDYGLPEEAAILAKELESLKLPIVGVLGNHEFESGKQEDVSRILSEAGAVMLDGDAYEIGGIGFAGVKGFAGGFGERALQPWGEQTIKGFVHEAIG